MTVDGWEQNKLCYLNRMLKKILDSFDKCERLNGNYIFHRKTFVYIECFKFIENNRKFTFPLLLIIIT